VDDPVRRSAVAGVYLAFLLPALMGLFAQIGGVQNPEVWRVSFVGIAVVGSVATARLLRQDVGRDVAAIRAGSVAAYAGIALLGAFPGIADVLGLRAIQAAALLLVLLVALGHSLVWRFLVQGLSNGAETSP
jgi:hypothetical protein